MKKKSFFIVAMLTLFVFLMRSDAYAGPAAPSGGIGPIVSTQWLADNAQLGNLVILDIRSDADYLLGHIPNSISVPFVVPVSAWIVLGPDGLLLEVPHKASLFNTLGSCGIRSDSIVVVVGKTANPPEPPAYSLANATRVADTLIYAGVRNVAILDGGYPKWYAEGRMTTTATPTITPVEYQGKVREGMFVSKEYVRRHTKKAAIIDARDPDVYYGVTVEPFADKRGHIPMAVSLPAPWMWSADGTYKDVAILKAMAAGAVDKHRDREIIVYCGVGGYASSWWFVLTQVLGFKNVKFYDGAAQDWVKSYDMVPYQWD